MSPGRRVEAVPPELRGGVSVTSPPPGSPEGGFGWSALPSVFRERGTLSFPSAARTCLPAAPIRIIPGCPDAR